MNQILKYCEHFKDFKYFPGDCFPVMNLDKKMTKILEYCEHFKHCPKYCCLSVASEKSEMKFPADNFPLKGSAPPRMKLAKIESKQKESCPLTL